MKMPSQKNTSYSYAQRIRAERIYGLIGSGDYSDLAGIDTAVLLALNYCSKTDGTDMRPAAETLALMTNLSRSSVRRSLARLVTCGLLAVDARQQHHAPVIYRFGAALLTRSDKTLREHLAEKRVLRELSRSIAGCSPRRERVLPQTRQRAQTAPAEGSPIATSVFPGTHRTNLEPIEELIIEPTPELTRMPDEKRASLRSHVSLAPTALTSPPVTTSCRGRTLDADVPVEDPSDTKGIAIAVPRVPTTDEEIAEFFEHAFDR
jgi:hypothetical protein